MRSFSQFLITLIVALGFALPQVNACTIFCVARNGQVIAASNKDWNNTTTRLWIIPPGNGKYGRLYFGYQLPEGFQNAGGMNDQGLWYSGASVPERGDIRNHSGKPTIQGELCEKALEECASVNEVIVLYQTYFTPHWQGHSLWADKYGNTIVIEYGERDVLFIRKNGDFQVITNFYLSDTVSQRWYNCYRYQTASELLRNSPEYSVFFISSVLQAVHQEGLYPTVSSNIYDLINGDLYFYYFHNYHERIRLNLHAEIARGEQYYKLPELYNQMMVEAPQSGESVEAVKVTLRWCGNAESYRVYCSGDSSFTECVPLEVNAFRQAGFTPAKFQRVFVFGLLLMLGWILFKCRKSISIIILFMLCLVCRCDLGVIESPFSISDIHHEVTLHNLEPATKYFWKVVSNHQDQVNTETPVQYFYTEAEPF